MTKYKLIKEYPGSLKLGTIAGDIFLSTTASMSCFPEFWEKVESPQYEIGKWYRNSVGLFCVTKIENDTVFAYGFCRENWSENESFPIRKYEEEDVLACEQEIENALICEAKKRCIISGKSIKSTSGVLGKITMGNWVYDLQQNKLYYGGFEIFDNGKWAEIATPLFTTEDGVAIFKGDNLFTVTKSFDVLFFPANDFDGKNKYCKYFSTNEKSYEYILLNKPCLSINDLIYSKNAPKGYATNAIMESFKELVKSKL